MQRRLNSKKACRLAQDVELPTLFGVHPEISVLRRIHNPVVVPAAKAVHPGFTKNKLAILFLALTAALTACNLRPLARSSIRWGYMDTTGRIVIPMRYERAQDFSEGLAAVEIDGRWAFIDRTGNEVIPARFISVYNFKSGMARVEIAPGSWRYIDRSGKIVIDLEFKYGFEALDFNEGLASIYIEDPIRFECLNKVFQNLRDDYNNSKGYIASKFCGRWGFINPTGAIVIEPQFIEAFDFSEGLAAVRVQDVKEPNQRRWRYGYIDRAGNVVIQPQFEAAFDFSEGLARVLVAGRMGFIDKTGRLVVEAKFDDAKDFHEGLAQVKIADRWGYLDRTGKLAIPAEFKISGRFSEGLAAANRAGNLGGYIDRTGSMVISEQFGVAWPFSEGLARVQIGDGRGSFNKWGYIDKSGKIVISRNVWGRPFREGLALVGDGGLF